jgi:AraC family transcriptional regulator of adaptative response / DNA-3-methyladenine glycosylase II
MASADIRNRLYVIEVKTQTPSYSHLNPDVLYKAWQARDRRFDGKAFIGVRTTGIYCRPICPAKTPLKKNVSFYPSATAAEQAGFRPCKRCRPDAGPGTPAWFGTSATVSRALRLILNGWTDEKSLDELSASLGIGERQLRRLFIQHLGAPPLAIIRTRKLDLSRKLLDETGLAISEIAFASGFQSLRRFNDAFKIRFKASPTEIRREINRTRGGARSTKAASEVHLQMRLAYRPPLAWDELLEFLKVRAIPGAEFIDGTSYMRSIRLSSGASWFKVEKSDRDGQLHLTTPVQAAGDLLETISRVRRILDLDHDPLAVDQVLSRDPDLRLIIRKHPGLRVPGAWSGFETAVRAILGQQVTVAAARTFASRIVEKFGERLSFDYPVGGQVDGQVRLTHLFPEPATLIHADLESLGIITSRANAIRVLAEKVHLGELDLSPGADLEKNMAELCKIKGIGPWTADYITLRVFRDPNAFLRGDLIIRRQLEGRDLQKCEEAWRPWSAYACLYLWKTSEGIRKDDPKIRMKRSKK